MRQELESPRTARAAAAGGGHEPAVLVVEDDAMVRGWLRLSLERLGFRIAGEAAGSAEARQLVERRRPDVLLVDQRLADGKGTALVRALRHRGVSIPAVLMTANPEPGFNEVAREVGAQGTVLKTVSSDQVGQALRLAVDGGGSFDARHPRREGGAALSPRERQVVRLAASGATNRAIAETLGVGEETVKTLLSRVFTKLGVRRRTEAVVVALQQGLV
jgi:DNA-binding NarL/FixJ family response regulator